MTLNFHDEYARLLGDLLRNGKEVSPRGQPTLEVQDVVFELPAMTDDGRVKGRTNMRYLLAEFAWYLSRDPSVDFVKAHASLWARVANPDGTANSNYGEKLWSVPPARWSVMRPEDEGRDMTEWGWARESLLDDRASRQAVMVVHRPEHHWKGNKDVPCTLTVGFTVRGDELKTRVHMRSSDAWFGLPYDVPFFLWLHRRMAWQVAARPGPLRVMLDSFHLYGHRLADAKRYLDTRSPAESWVNPIPSTVHLDEGRDLALSLLAVNDA